MLVTVVITNFDNARYVGRAIRSVRDQTFDDWDLIVVDDASTDDSVDVIRTALEGEKRSSLVVMSRNSGGPGIPRNRAVGEARGRWVAFLDADDVWHPRKLELQLAAAELVGARMVSSRRWSFRRDSEIRFEENREALAGDLSGTRMTHGRLVRKNFLCTASVMGHRELFLESPFHPDRRYRAVEDYWCWLKVHRHGIAWSWLMRTPLVYYRLAETSISRSRLEMIRKHWMLYGDYFDRGVVGSSRRLASMTSYAWYSLLRLASERLFGVR